MTVTYNSEVATCKGLGVFWKLLFRWRGSIYKLLWPNVVVYILFYYVLFFVYKFALDADGKRIFETISNYCKEYSDLIPLSFVLGFYVNLVVKRWQEMFQSIPSTDTLALFVSNSIHGQDERCRLMRRTIMRYINLSYVLILSMISSRVKKRFPSLDHLVEAGIMLPNEKKIFDDLNSRSRHPKYWMPLVWAGSIIARARKEGRIRDDFAVKTLLDELCNFRSKCGALNGYDWVAIPLVYTQVVTLAVYSYVALTLMGRQLIEGKENIYFPAIAFIQFFFYMGWLKVAESLVNPFGEDDDDFETNWLIDRNLQVSYLIVDEMHAEHPELIRDQYWDDVLPDELPHTVASQPFRSSPYMGSTAQLEMSPQQAEIFLPATPQLHRLAEESDENETDEEMLPIDGGESGIPAKRRLRRSVTRQVSGESEAPSSLTVTRKPSVMSVFQRVFQKDGSTMGSNLSLRSNRNRPVFGRSVSRISTGAPATGSGVGVSRPHSPYAHQNQDDIFKMSDLNINEDSPDPPILVEKPPLPPLNFKMPDRLRKYGKNLTVENENEIASGLSSGDEGEELLLPNSNATTPLVTPMASPSQQQSLSPVTQNSLENSPFKTSPRLIRQNPISVPSPHGSPKVIKASPVSFYMGSDGSQTDRAVPPKTVTLAEMEHLVEEEIDDEELTPTKEDVSIVESRASAVSSAFRMHRDSFRDGVGTELEPIEEQAERSDFSPVSSKSPLDAEE